QEIIEFPVLAVNSRTLEIESKFHEFVKPLRSKRISTFCTELTNITQEIVNRSEIFPKVLDKFEIWMTEQGFLTGEFSFAFVTCGDWDLSYMIKKQCRTSQIHVPPYFDNWINIKETFKYALNVPRQLSLQKMLDFLKMEFKGRPHSGIDDTYNTALILIRLIE
ncbi:UNVERIFIED_CONTAM: hypothetical protein GTU68_018193, partial [Idotea baltica]|nr:hypothetical protein [Idotea baltica]